MGKDIRTQFHNPHSDSKLAYFYEGFKLIETANSFVAGEPVILSASMSHFELYAAEKHNAFCETFSRSMRVNFMDELVASGYPPERLSEPLAPKIEAIVSEMVCRRIDSYVAFAKLPGSRSFISFFDVHARIIEACQSYFAKSRASKFSHVASCLNDGIPTKAESQGLERSHINRAQTLYLKNASKARRAFSQDIFDFFLIEMTSADLMRVAALDYLWREAANDKRLKLCNGRALARRIHELLGLPFCVDRAIDRAAA